MVHLFHGCYLVRAAKQRMIFPFGRAGGACRLAAHLDSIDFDVSLVITEWFLCLFAKSLPSEVCAPSSVLLRRFFWLGKKALLCLRKAVTCSTRSSIELGSS